MPTQMTIQQALRLGVGALQQNCSIQTDLPSLDVELLLSHCLGVTRTHLFTWPDQVLTDEQDASYHALLARRTKGEPIAYIVGEQGFWSLNLDVNPSVLIPRPETELLVTLALGKVSGVREEITIADLGTGSGAIALALASEVRSAKVIGVDASRKALAVAKKNAQKCDINNVNFLESDWCAALTGGDELFDLIVSNPPYIESEDRHLSQGDLRFEPNQALISGNKGLADLQCICDQAFELLKPGAWLLLEHGYNQGSAVSNILQQGGYKNIELHQDFNGMDRVSCGQIVNQ